MPIRVVGMTLHTAFAQPPDTQSESFAPFVNNLEIPCRVEAEYDNFKGRGAPSPGQRGAEKGRTGWFPCAASLADSPKVDMLHPRYKLVNFRG